jgi:GT2 family glycosyltransferase
MHAVLARLAVVVPVGPGDTLPPPLRGQLAAFPRDAQVHVVCAETTQAESIQALLHAQPGPQWLCTAASHGRASQQNAGAAAAARDWLWFLHADARLTPDTLPALARFIDDDADALGYFDLRFLDDGPALMRLNAFGARLRSRWLGLPFGDQGLVLRRATFARLGGFDIVLTSGEDHDLVWRARRAGVLLRAVGAPLYTSARKYAERGWWTTTARHLRDTWRQARRFSRMRVL